MVIRPLLATAKPMSPQEPRGGRPLSRGGRRGFRLIDRRHGAAGDRAGPGQGGRNAKETILRSDRAGHGLRPARGSGRELMPYSEWRKICSVPVSEVYKVIGPVGRDDVRSRPAMAQRGRQQLLWMASP